MFNFDCFHNVFGGSGNFPPDPADLPDLPETVSGTPDTTDPVFPAPGLRMTVVTTNSLKTYHSFSTSFAHVF